MTTELTRYAFARDEDGPREGEAFADYLVREDAEIQAQLDRQMAFLEGADFADLHLVLDAVLNLLEEDDDDPRILAGVRTLARLLGHRSGPGTAPKLP